MFIIRQNNVELLLLTKLFLPTQGFHNHLHIVFDIIPAGMIESKLGFA